jgi:hypothetical protein
MYIYINVYARRILQSTYLISVYQNEVLRKYKVQIKPGFRTEWKIMLQTPCNL